MSIIIGIGGMVLILAAFILDEFVPTFNQDTWRYNLLNILGSGLLAYYAYTIPKGWPFVVLNVVWMIAAGIKSVEILTRKGRRA